MLKLRSTKLMCLLIAFIWTTVIIGSSYAYFIDSVTVTGNVIAAGNLKASLEYMDKSTGKWEDASNATIFNYQRWEPGYTDVQYIRMSNMGDLAFQYELNIVPDVQTALMDVIDVYFGEVETGYRITNRAAFWEQYDAGNLKKLGTLRDLLNNNANPHGLNGANTGVLLKGESQTACIVLHMQEEAGNEYQNLSVGEGFKVQMFATQYMHEEDSFGKDYDEDAKSELPELKIPTSMTIQVQPVNGLVPSAVVFDDPVNGVSATVPAGAKMVDGATSLTLIVSPMDNSKADINEDENEVRISYNVKVEGLATDNTVPAVINMGEVLPKGLNIGNYALYHVENNATHKMTPVDSAADLDVHNEFTYNPVNGEVTVAMATFSEVALVADTVNAWNGDFDYSWYTNAVAPVTEADPDYVIANADQLAAFGAIVGGMNEQTQDSFAKKTVKLVADVNLGYDEEHNDADKIFYPIGYYNSTGSYVKTSGGSVTSSVSSFEGTFDGNGHTIANFYQNTWEMFGDYNDGYSGTPNHYKDAMGLFGYVVNGKVCNLTVDNFESDGEFTPTGVIAAYAVNSTFENIAITNCNPRVYNTGNGGIVGIGGNNDDPDTYNLTFINITIDNTNKITALWGSWDVACGGLVGMFRGAGHVYMTNCHVAAQVDVYNDVCGNYQYYWYRYSGMMVGTNKNMVTDKDGYTVPETSKFHAEGCTVHFGNWNDYYYCELVANSLASYTHDHQFSRLEQISSLDEIKSGDHWTKTGNFLLISGDAKTCYHIVKNADGTLKQHLHTDAGEETVNGKTVLKENNQIIYLPFNQLFTGYGWGVKHIPVYNGEDYAFEGIKILDRTVADSEEKFEKGDNAKTEYTTGTVVKISDLFAAKPGVEIKSEQVQVFVSPVGDASTASGTYVANISDWTQGTLTFSGTGAAQITITDYYFCKPAIIDVTINPLRDFNATFVDKEGNPVEVIPFKEGDTELTKEPDVPNRPGYNGTWEEYSVIDNNFTVKPVYTPIKYEVTFMADGVKVGEDTYTVETDPGDIKIPAVPEKPGYNGEWPEFTLEIGGTTVHAVYTKIPAEFAPVFENTTKYIYRVGNANAVSLSSLFKLTDDEMIVEGLDVSIATVKGDASGAYTANTSDWTKGTIQFSGTGVVKVTITDNNFCTPTELFLEVVNATNHASASISSLGSGNVVLLDNTKLNSNGALALQNASLYGNGFELDVSAGRVTGESITANYLLYLNNGILDNVRITGAVYTSFNATSSKEYNNPVVLSIGNSVIMNSKISNCAAPVRVRSGNLTIEDSVLKGGSFANLDIRGGKVVLKNVTTINQLGLNDTAADGTEVVGLGIVVYYEGPSADTKIKIEGNLTQRNNVAENTSGVGSYAEAFLTEVFKDTYAQYHYTKDGVKWVNTGIISLNEAVLEGNIDNQSHNNKSDYAGKNASFEHPNPLIGTANGYIYAPKGAEPITTDVTVLPAYGPIMPKVSFDHTVNEHVKQDGSETSCTSDPLTNVETITFAAGESFTWNTQILKSSNKDIEYTVWMDGVQCDENITFDETGTHTIVFKYTDENNYRLNNEGKVEKYLANYEASMQVIVNEQEATAKNAEITFPLLASYGTTKVTVDGKTYIMPNLTGTNVPKYGDDLDFDASTRKYGSLKSDGKTSVDIYYPIIKTAISGNYMVFPVFGNKNGTLVQIQDYADKGMGDKLTPYNGSTQAMPEGLSVSRGYTVQWQTDKEVVGSGKMNYGSWTSGVLAFKYQSSSDDIALKVMSNYLSYYPNINLRSNDRNEQVMVAEYKYVDAKGDTFYYCVGYHIEERNSGYAFGETVPESGGSSCVAPETLVTLADGTQVRVDSLTGNEKLLVWNMQTGMLDEAAIMFVDNDPVEEYDIVHLYFSDGTDVKVIYEHGFWDYDLNKYVYLDKDAEQYIGHTFAKQNGNELAKVKLTNVVIEKERTTAWSPVTVDHLCYFVNGMLSMPGGVGGLFNIFDVDPATMAYDMEALARDIETYGLYTYEELNAIVALPEEMFNAAGGAYLKVSIGKGNLTMDELVYMIERYTKYFK